jgi:hypothetical protein
VINVDSPSTDHVLASSRKTDSKSSKTISSNLESTLLALKILWKIEITPGMKTWRGISHQTLQTTKFTRLASTRHKPTSIASLLKSAAESTASESPEIEVKGYVRTIRKQKRIAFAAIEDGSSLQPVQAVLTPDQALPYVTL